VIGSPLPDSGLYGVENGRWASADPCPGVLFLLPWFVV
jgi:hypothetical protein